MVGQLVLAIENGGNSLPETITNYISYFTIQTNMLVAISLICLWLWPSSTWGKFFARPRALTALTLYITIVGMV